MLALVERKSVNAEMLRLPRSAHAGLTLSAFIDILEMLRLQLSRRSAAEVDESR